jgi:hypothetical protein
LPNCHGGTGIGKVLAARSNKDRFWPIWRGFTGETLLFCVEMAGIPAESALFPE